MNRLISCSVISASLVLVASCSGDPTESLREGVQKLNSNPSQLFLQQGKTGAVVVTATDEQGNQIETAFEITSVGPGLTVERDPTFRPVFVNDELVLPERDALFRYRVTANELVSSSFIITAEGKADTIPVNVTPDPVLIPQAAVSSSGSNPQDTMTLTLPAPYSFQGGSTVTFVIDPVAGTTGSAVVVGRSTDGSQLKVLPLPGSVGAGSITGIAINYLPTVPLASTTDTLTPVTVGTTVTPIAGTGDPATAPTITLAPGEQSGVLDAGSMAAASCGQLSGLPCQLYRFSLADSAVVHVRLQGEGPADLGLYFMNAADLSDADQLCDEHGRADVPEECDLEFGPGDYLASVASFGPLYPENDPNPAWVALQIGLDLE